MFGVLKHHQENKIKCYYSKCGHHRLQWSE